MNGRGLLKGLIIFSFGVGAIVLLIIGLNYSGSEGDAARVRDTYPIDPLFKDLYQRLGAEGRMGPAITPLFEKDGKKMQYLETALLVYEENPRGRYYLASLGTQLGFSDPERSPSAYADEDTVHELFYSFYKEMGGRPVFGRPLTFLQLNTEQNRLEQHFENLGVYVPLNNPDQPPALLAYGAYACDYNCRYSLPLSNAAPKANNWTDAFLLAEENLGTGFIGINLLGPYVSPDGKVEAIYENVVLWVDPEQPTQAMPRAIVEKLGIARQQPVKYLDNPLVIFYTVEGELGFNIPVVFRDYLEPHGGLAVAGAPISELNKVAEGHFQQCFTNLCVDYYPQAEEDQKIKLAPLGRRYLNDVYVTMELRKAKATVSSSEPQVIYVTVLENAKPLAGAQLQATIILPNGERITQTLPTTDENGRTSFSIAPVAALNGALVEYRVCVISSSSYSLCKNDSYVIWGD